MTAPLDQLTPAEWRRRHKLAATSALPTTLICTLLIWAKLRLVTDIPRTAYAVPQQAGVSSGNSPKPSNAEPSPSGSARLGDDAHAAAAPE
jgi:hypothetical protein